MALVKKVANKKEVLVDLSHKEAQLRGYKELSTNPFFVDLLCALQHEKDGLVSSVLEPPAEILASPNYAKWQDQTLGEAKALGRAESFIRQTISGLEREVKEAHEQTNISEQ